MSMQKTLSQNLVALVTAFCKETGYAASSVGIYAARDPRFFTKLVDGKPGSFTVRKYDEVLAYFAAKWPDGLRWPAGIDRPSVASAEKVIAAAARKNEAKRSAKQAA